MKKSFKRPVLIVDDDKSVLNLIYEFAEDAFTPICIESAQSARRIIETEQIDAVISDIRMPAEDGISLLKWLKSNHPIIPVIMMIRTLRSKSRR